MEKSGTKSYELKPRKKVYLFSTTVSKVALGRNFCLKKSYVIFFKMNFN